MKGSTIVTGILLAAMIAITSCKKDDAASPTSSNSPVPTGSAFTFKVDGTAVTADSAFAVLYTLFVPPYNREIDVFAFKGGIQVFEGHFHPQVGTQAAAQNFNGCWLTYQTATQTFDSQSGSLVLTTCDTTGNNIRGTFAFVGVESVGGTTHAITDGNMVVTRLTR